MIKSPFYRKSQIEENYDTEQGGLDLSDMSNIKRDLIKKASAMKFDLPYASEGLQHFLDNKGSDLCENCKKIKKRKSKDTL